MIIRVRNRLRGMWVEDLEPREMLFVGFGLLILHDGWRDYYI